MLKNRHFLIVVRKNSPYKSFADIIADAKQSPGQVTGATVGAGTQSQFVVDLIKIHAGVDISSLPYKSGGEVMTSLLGGQVNFACTGLPPSIGLLKTGDLRALASTYGKISGFPNISTVAELGYPKATLGVSVGYYLPKGTPQPIVKKMAASFEKAMKNPVVKKGLEDSGQVLDYQDGTSLAKFMLEENKMFEDVLRKAKLI